MTQPKTEPFDLNLAIEQLISQGYKVTRPFTPRDCYANSPPPALLKAAIIDTETTGTNPITDKIIEMGIVLVEYCPNTGLVYRVLDTYNQLEDPGMPIPIESTKVHGITDAMVSGQTIIDSEVEALIEDVSLIIAHNAAFDRNFVEARLPFFQNKAWGCSFAQIPWKIEGFSSASLEFLAYKFGFHFHGHRASIDCHALLEILQSELPLSGIKVFKRLLDNVQSPNTKLWALSTPYESKDKLKQRGYRWDGERKTWYAIVANDDLGPETAWLQTEVYANRNFKLEQEKLDAYNRFSNRRGEAKIVNY